MIKTLFLHIGTPKTGSSSIQKSLVGYDDGRTKYLEPLTSTNHNLLLPAFSPPGSSEVNWGANDNGENKDLLKLKLENAKLKFENAILSPSHENLIVSAEALCILAEDGVKKFFNFIHDLNRDIDIKVICYLREPKSFAASELQQRVKRHHSPKIFEVPDKINLHFVHGLKKFVPYVDSDSLIVREFNRDKLVNNCVVEDICKIMNIKITNIHQTNESLNIPTLKIVIVLNRSMVTYGSQNLYRARIKFIEKINEAYSGSPMLDKEIFTGMYRNSEIIFCKQFFKIDFTKSIGEFKSKKLLQNLLHDISDIDHKPLNNIILKSKINVDIKSSITNKIIAIYKSYLK